MKKNEHLELLGNLIKSQREARGWNWYRLSKETGISIYNIQRLEQGCNATILTYMKVFQAFGLQITIEPLTEDQDPVS
jgi:transcriptional regulator with XRE-family HTH domain